MILKVMTYNIQGGRDNSRLGKPPVNLKACTQVIGDENPDICGLNEVDYKLDRSGKIRFIDVMSGDLGFKGAFAPAITIGTGTYGNGLLSRHPLTETEIFPIPDPEDKSEDTHYESRVILHSIADFNGKPADVFVTHFGLAKSEQKNAVDTLIPLIKAAENPVILMGDFNVTPDNPVLNPIYEVLCDTFAVYPNREEATFPSHASMLEKGRKPVKIDYIFVSPQFKVVKTEIPQCHVSDHRPYITYLELN